MDSANRSNPQRNNVNLEDKNNLALWMVALTSVGAGVFLILGLGVLAFFVISNIIDGFNAADHIGKFVVFWLVCGIIFVWAPEPRKHLKSIAEEIYSYLNSR